MTGNLISADYPEYLCKKLEYDNGGIGIYFNGAQGNINPSMFIKYDSPYASDDPAMYVAAEKYGENLAEYVETALENGKLFKNLPLEVAKTLVNLPLENPSFIYAMLSGMINRDVIITPEGFLIQAEIFGIKMGPIEMVSVPGELFSEVSLFIKDQMPKYGMVLGLTTELLGYLIPQDQWSPGSGEVGESMSMSANLVPILTQGLLEVIATLA